MESSSKSSESSSVQQNQERTKRIEEHQIPNEKICEQFHSDNDDRPSSSQQSLIEFQTYWTWIKTSLLVYVSNWIKNCSPCRFLLSSSEHVNGRRWISAWDYFALHYQSWRVLVSESLWQKQQKIKIWIFSAQSLKINLAAFQTAGMYRHAWVGILARNHLPVEFYIRTDMKSSKDSTRSVVEMWEIFDLNVQQRWRIFSVLGKNFVGVLSWHCR